MRERVHRDDTAPDAFAVHVESITARFGPIVYISTPGSVEGWREGKRTLQPRRDNHFPSDVEFETPNQAVLGDPIEVERNETGGAASVEPVLVDRVACSSCGRGKISVRKRRKREDEP